MITDSEKKALQLAKKVFEQFTHYALPIAREIIAMEFELGQTPIDEPAINVEPRTILEVKIKEEQLVTELLNDFPNSDMAVIGLEDPAQPVKQMNNELVYQTDDDFPF